MNARLHCLARSTCLLVVSTALICIGQGCAVTPTTRATICVRDYDTGGPVQGSLVRHSENAMFKPGRSHGEGSTGVDGCATLSVGLLEKISVFIDTSSGIHYHCVLAHPRIDPSRSQVVLRPMFDVEGPSIEVALMEID